MTAALLPMFLLGQAVATIGNSANQDRVSRPTAGPSDVDQVICRDAIVTGSRVRPSRICRTRAEWAELDAENQELVGRVSSIKPFPAGGCAHGRAGC